MEMITLALNLIALCIIAYISGWILMAIIAFLSSLFK